MTSVNISREFATFAEALTWADDELERYLEKGYEALGLAINRFDDFCLEKDVEIIYNVHINLEKKD